MAEDINYNDGEDGDTTVKQWRVMESYHVSPKGGSSKAAFVTRVSKSSMRFHLNTQQMHAKPQQLPNYIILTSKPNLRALGKVFTKHIGEMPA